MAIITVAASGIGKATALLFAHEGAKVIVSDIDESMGQSVVKEIQSKGGIAFFIKADTSSAADNENLVKQAVGKYGALHIAVNNSRIGGPQAPIGE